MSDIRTITQEFSTSGSLANTQEVLQTPLNNTDTSPECGCHESVIFLTKKIDELIAEVNTLKNA
jgi:hypothetical protein